MKVILRVPDEGYSRYASCALNLIDLFFINTLLLSVSTTVVDFFYIDFLVA